MLLGELRQRCELLLVHAGAVLVDKSVASGGLIADMRSFDAPNGGEMRCDVRE